MGSKQVLNIGTPHFLGVFLLVTILSGCSLFQQQQTAKKPAKQPEKADTAAKAEDLSEAEKARIDSIAKAKKRKDSLDQLYPIRKPDTLSVAVILPLFAKQELDNNLTLSKRTKKISNIAREYYLGTHMAMDSLRNCGLHIRLKVFDSRNDSLRMLTIREKLKGNNVDLILGPLFTENIKLLNQFTQRTKTNMVSPLANVPNCLKSNPYYISMDPGKDVIARQVANLINRKFEGANIFVVRQYANPERRIAKRMDQLVDTNKVNSYQKLVLKETQYNTSKVFKDTLKKAKNVIFIPSKDEAFITSAISGIKGVDTVFTIDSINRETGDTAKTYYDIQDDVTLIGLPDWLDYGSIDGNMMEQFDMHILSDYHVNYQHLPTADFVRAYRRKNHTEPSKYAIKGYDFMLVLGKLVDSYGIFFQRYWQDLTLPGIHTQFHFQQETEQRGWQNYYLEKLIFKDYELQQANR